MRIFIAVMVLIAGTAHAELNAIGKARGLDPHRIDKDTNEKLSKMDNTLYTNCVLWQQMSYDDTPNYYDLSTSTNNGTQSVTNSRPAWTNLQGGYFVFDGIDDHIVVGTNSSLDVTSNYTHSLWMYAEEITANAAVSGRWDDGVSDGFAIRVFTGDDDVSAGHAVSAVFGRVDSLTNIDDGSWHHCVGVFEAGVGVKLYVDGILQGTDATPSTPIPSFSQNFHIGNQDRVINPRPFNGRIDEVILLNRALSSNEVYNLYIDEPTTANGGKR